MGIQGLAAIETQAITRPRKKCIALFCSFSPKTLMLRSISTSRARLRRACFLRPFRDCIMRWPGEICCVGLGTVWVQQAPRSLSCKNAKDASKGFSAWRPCQESSQSKGDSGQGPLEVVESRGPAPIVQRPLPGQTPPKHGSCVRRARLLASPLGLARFTSTEPWGFGFLEKQPNNNKLLCPEGQRSNKNKNHSESSCCLIIPPRGFEPLSPP